jgi:lambda family phage tail tape measure protein
MSTIDTSFRIIASVIGANTFRELGRTVGGVSSAADGLRRSFATAALGLKAFAATQAVSMFSNFISETVHANVELKKISQQAGVSTKLIAQLRGAVEATGGTFGDVEEVFDSFNEKYIELQRGNADVKRAFDAMGVSVKDAKGNFKSSETVFRESYDALSKMQDGGKKSAIAMESMADGMAKLLPTVNKGTGFLEKFGQSIDDDVIDSSMELNELWVIMKERISGITISFSKGLFPALQDVLKAFVGTDNAGNILQGSKKGWEQFGKIVGDVFRGIAIAILEVRKQWLNFLGLIQSAPQIGSIIKKELANTFMPWSAPRSTKEEYSIINQNLAQYQIEKDALSNIQSDLASKTLLSSTKSGKGFGDMLGSYFPKAKGFLDQITGTTNKTLEETRKNFKGNKTYQDYGLNLNPPKKQAKSDSEKQAEKDAKTREKEMEDITRWQDLKKLSNKSLLEERKEIGKTADEIELMRAERQWQNEVDEKSIGLSEVAKTKLKEMSNLLKGNMLQTLQENQYAKGTQAIREWVDSQKSATQAFQDQREELGKSADEVERLRLAREIDNEVTQKSAEYQGALKEQFLEQASAIKIAREEELKKTQEQRRSFATGANSFLSEYTDSVTNTAENTRQAFEKAFSGAEDALVGFLNGGKASFADFAKSILEDMQRMIIKQAILNPIAGYLQGLLGTVGSAVTGSFMGTTMAGVSGGVPTDFTVGAGGAMPSNLGMSFANGGIMTSGGEIPLHKYARGGVAKSPQMALFGEGSMAEAYVPLPDGRSIPVSMRGGGGGQVNNVTVNVSVLGDKGRESQSAMGSASNEMGKNLGKVISDVVKTTLINEKRPGGLLAR